MRKFGLIGFPLGHSYSKDFFTKRFEELSLHDHVYDLIEMERINEFPALWLKNKELAGVNVTVPHKENVLRFLDFQDISVIKVGAANVIHKKNGKLTGYNTDYIAFRDTLSNWLEGFDGEALVLGSGGSSKAVQAALEELNIDSYQVSRLKSKGDYTYEHLLAQPEIIARFKLIINTTPLGMHPKIKNAPDIPYHMISSDHHLYDLVYNPGETLFLSKGKDRGAKIKNGLEMLELQAEKSWEIWNTN